MPRDSLFLIKTKQANSQTQRVSSPSARGRKPREPLGVTTIQLARLPPMHGHCPLLGPCLGQSSPPPPALPRLSRYFHHFLIFFCFRSSILAKPSPGEATSPSHHVCLGKGDTLAWLVPPCPHPPSDGDRGGQDHPPTAPDPPPSASFCNRRQGKPWSRQRRARWHLEGILKPPWRVMQGETPLRAAPVPRGATSPFPGCHIPFPWLPHARHHQTGHSKPQPPASSPFPTPGHSAGSGRGTVTPTGM